MEKRKSKFSIISPVEDVSSTPTDVCIEVNAADENHNNSFETTQSEVTDSFFIVWLSKNTDNSVKAKDDLIMRLRPIISTIQTFIDIDECIDFLTNIIREKVFMIICDHPVKTFLSVLDEIPQLHVVYIFNHQDEHESSMEQCGIIKRVCTEMDHMCKAIKQDFHRLVDDLTPISIMPPSSSLNPNELDQSLMYTQLIKEIIMDTEYDTKKATEEFTQFLLAHAAANDVQESAVRQFQRCYEEHTAIWWYKKEWFVYSSLNRALRTQDVEFILKMGFFVQDLHREIEKRHTETDPSSKLIIYRGQALSNIDFEKLQKSEGGLLSFNSFLSTSVERQVSFAFAESSWENSSQTAVLFKMTIDPSESPTPFALIDDIGPFKGEAEILFSMHTVFRIGDMKRIDTHLWEVDLSVTGEYDQQLKNITDIIRNQMNVANGEDRVAILMMSMGKYDKVLESCNAHIETLSEGDSTKLEMAQNIVGCRIGEAEIRLGNYSTALLKFEKVLKETQKYRPWDYGWIGSIYRNIGLVHYLTGTFPTALLSCEKALENYQRCIPFNPILLVQTYTIIALINQSMGFFQSAAEYFEKALELQQKFLPSDHLGLATCYHNISLAYESLCQYSLALSYIEKALETREKYLPRDHPDLAMSHNNIGLLYKSMGKYTLALSHFEKALEIQEKSLPSNHPHLVSSRSNIAVVYGYMGNFSRALTILEETLHMWETSLPSNHPTLAAAHFNISQVHQAMGNYSIALSSLDKVLEIQQKSLPSNHPHKAITYNMFAQLYQLTNNHSVALSYCDKALQIQQQSLPFDHLDFARTYSNIGRIHETTGDYITAISYQKKTLEIQQKVLPPDHLVILCTYCSIGNGYRLRNDYSSALLYYEKALEINQNLSSHNYSYSIFLYYHMGLMHQLLGNYFIAEQFHQKTLEIKQKILAPCHLLLHRTYNNLAIISSFNQDAQPMISNIENRLKVELKATSANRSLLDAMGINTDEVNDITKNYLAAYAELRKACELQERVLAEDRLGVTMTDENTDSAEEMMRKCINGLSMLEKAMQLQKKASFVSHPSHIDAQDDTTGINQMWDNYLATISNLKKACQAVSSNDQHENYNDNSDDSKATSRDYISTAMSALQAALKTKGKHSSPNDVSYSTEYSVVGQACYSCKDYANALLFFEKALEILQKCVPVNQQLLAETYNNLAMTLDGLQRYNEAVDYAKQAVGTARSFLRPPPPPPKTISGQVYANLMKFSGYASAVVERLW